jgi:hypothetical protein
MCLGCLFRAHGLFQSSLKPTSPPFNQHEDIIVHLESERLSTITCLTVSPSLNSAHVDLMSEQEASLLSPPSTTHTFTPSDSNAHSRRPKYYTQPPMSDQEQVGLYKELRPTCFSLKAWIYEVLSLSLAFVAITLLVFLLFRYDKRHRFASRFETQFHPIVIYYSASYRLQHDIIHYFSPILIVVVKGPVPLRHFS